MKKSKTAGHICHFRCHFAQMWISALISCLMQSSEISGEILVTQALVIPAVCWASPTPAHQSSLSFTCSYSKMDLTGLSSKGQLLLVLCVSCYLYTCSDAEGSCKLKAKFNLRGYKEVLKKTVVIGGMFPVHQRLVSTDTNTTIPPESSDCEA